MSSRRLIQDMPARPRRATIAAACSTHTHQFEISLYAQRRSSQPPAWGPHALRSTASRRPRLLTVRTQRPRPSLVTPFLEVVDFLVTAFFGAAFFGAAFLAVAVFFGAALFPAGRSGLNAIGA